MQKISILNKDRNNNNLMLSSKLENSEYKWMIGDDNIETVIKKFNKLSFQIKDINCSLWCRVISLWLQGFIVDINSNDLHYLKNNLKQVFISYKENEKESFIYLLDILQWKIGNEKYNLFVKWFNNSMKNRFN